MPRNKLTDLNDHLFAALERLNDEEMKPEVLEREIARARAISDVGKRIIENAKVTLDAVKFVQEEGMYGQLPENFGVENKELKQ